MPYCPNPTNQPFLVQTNIKRAILPVQLLLSVKNRFLIFWMPLQIGYLNLWDIFRFIFRQLRMTFFHKIMVVEKKNFFFNCMTQFCKGYKVISKCKNDKLKKIKSKKCQPHPTPFLRRPAPAPYFCPLLHILIILGTKY